MALNLTNYGHSKSVLIVCLDSPFVALQWCRIAMHAITLPIFLDVFNSLLDFPSAMSY